MEAGEREPGELKPGTPRHMGGGSFVLMAGLVLGLVGVGIAMLGNARGADKYLLREVGISLAGLSVPLLFLGHLMGHEGVRWHRLAAWAGLGLCAAGLAGFVAFYPDHFNVPEGDRSLAPVLAYSVGLAVSAGSSFAALVADYVRHVQGLRAEKRARGDDEARSLSKADISRDIEEAMGKYRYTWGGIKEGETERRIKVSVHTDDLKILSGKFGRETVGSFAPAGDSLTRLSAFRGGRNRTGEINPAGVADAASALRALRTDPNRPVYKPGLVERVKGWFTRSG